MPSITIDGQTLEFLPGDTIITLATRHRIVIPFYCWHPELSIAANCRMCLVEVEKAPKPVPACQTECKEGMIVKTATPKVKELQRSIHEFLLVNHPIDCPICDQAGECKLQDYYMQLQLTPSPMREQKVRKAKAQPLGPYVIYDAERCIMCTRCVRFMEEIAKDRQLGVFSRGDHAWIGVFDNQPLDNPYSLNVVDLCPVGALTSRVFRFKQRVWNLSRSPSLCPGCARGCNIFVDFRANGVYRFLPRENAAVNQSWLCDEGRLCFKWANESRLTHCLASEAPGQLAEPCDAKKAISQASSLLAQSAKAGSKTAVAISLQATCEEAYLAGRLAKELLKTDTIYLLARSEGPSDSFLRVSDRNPNRQGITQVLVDLGLKTASEESLFSELSQKSCQSLLVLGHDPENVEKLNAAIMGLKAFVLLSYRQTKLCETAQVVFPILPWVQTEGTWINVQGRLQRLNPIFSAGSNVRGADEWLTKLAAGLGASWNYPSVKAIRNEMIGALPSFSGSKPWDLDSDKLPEPLGD